VVPAKWNKGCGPKKWNREKAFAGYGKGLFYVSCRPKSDAQGPQHMKNDHESLEKGE